MRLKLGMIFDTERSSTDHILTASIFLLLGLGFVTLYSSSYLSAQIRYQDGLRFISSQARSGILGIFCFFLASAINLELVRKMIKPLVVFSLILCFLTRAPYIGVTKNNAPRWIAIGGGHTFQPSELVKLILPLYLAHLFDKKRERIDSISRGILPPLIISGFFFGSVIYQKDFSTAVFLVINVFILFFLAGVKLRYVISALIIFVIFATLLVLIDENRLMRFVGFLNPKYDTQGANYQVNQSVNAIVSGGFLGKGLGLGTAKISNVPEIQADFVFSAYAEELGFLGIILLCFLFGVFAVRGYVASMRNENHFNRLFGTGLVTMIVSQALLNIAVVIHAVPATGIPLPFFSAGGSSLVVTMAMAGFVVNVSGHSKEKV